MKYPFPVKTHSGLKLVITQGYGDVSNADWYKAHNLSIPFHNGVDVVLSGNDMQTYGAEIITPADGWHIVTRYEYNDPMSPNGNGIVIHSPVFTEDGVDRKIELRFVHMSEVTNLPAKQPLPAFTTLGYIGNSGLVNPKPIPGKPYQGAHLHLGMCIIKMANGKEVVENANNGVYGMVDPLTRFDINVTVNGKDTGVDKDLPPIIWAYDKLGITSVWEKILFALKNWWNGK